MARAQKRNPTTAQKIDISVPADPQIALGRIRSLIQKILHESGRAESGILGVIFVDHETSQMINRQFLTHDYPTDVIAFEYDDGEDDGEDDKWGEIYINVQKAREQAVEYGVPYENELARLIIHGLLHLSGYDDQDDASRAEMKRREDELVGRYAVLIQGSKFKIQK